MFSIYTFLTNCGLHWPFRHNHGFGLAKAIHENGIDVVRGTIALKRGEIWTIIIRRYDHDISVLFTIFGSVTSCAISDGVLRPQRGQCLKFFATLLANVVREHVFQCDASVATSDVVFDDIINEPIESWMGDKLTSLFVQPFHGSEN